MRTNGISLLLSDSTSYVAIEKRKNTKNKNNIVYSQDDIVALGTQGQFQKLKTPQIESDKNGKQSRKPVKVNSCVANEGEVDYRTSLYFNIKNPPGDIALEDTRFPKKNQPKLHQMGQIWGILRSVFNTF